MFLLIFYVLIALFFSFLCSIAEAVLLCVTQPYIASLTQKGNRSGALLEQLKKDVNRPLAAILSLNTVAHTVGATGAGAQALLVFGSTYMALFSAILTLLILVFSEIIPKTIGAVYWRQLAPVMAPTIKYLIWLLYPLVLLSEGLTRWLSHKGHEKEFSREEFAAMADLGREEGELETEELHILRNLLRFRSTLAKDIMTPRTVVFSLPENLTIAEYFDQHSSHIFSRIPIYRNDREDLTGYVLKNDLLLAHAQNDHHLPLHEFKRELKVVPTTKSLSELFELFIRGREPIALTVDEHGGMAGIVTLEDVVETLVGMEIVDESDETVDMQALARDLWEERAQKNGLITDVGEPPTNEEKDDS